MHVKMYPSPGSAPRADEASKKLHLAFDRIDEKVDLLLRLLRSHSTSTSVTGTMTDPVTSSGVEFNLNRGQNQLQPVCMRRATQSNSSVDNVASNCVDNAARSNWSLVLEANPCMKERRFLNLDYVGNRRTHLEVSQDCDLPDHESGCISVQDATVDQQSHQQQEVYHEECIGHPALSEEEQEDTEFVHLGSGLGVEIDGVDRANELICTKESFAFEDEGEDVNCSEIEAEVDEEGDLAPAGNHYCEARDCVSDDQESLQHQVVPHVLGIGQSTLSDALLGDAVYSNLDPRLDCDSAIAGSLEIIYYNWTMNGLKMIHFVIKYW